MKYTAKRDIKYFKSGGLEDYGMMPKGEICKGLRDQK